MTGGAVPDPFAGHPDWALEAPRSIVPTPAKMSGQLRGRRVVTGLPGHGWRADLRADEKVVQGSRTYVPVMVDGRPIAVVSAYVDQTEIRNRFQDTFLLAAGSLSLVIALAFGIPVVAWYRRSEQKLKGDERITFLAHHDALTGLTNRARLVEELEHMLPGLPGRDGGIALHFIDLDRRAVLVQICARAGAPIVSVTRIL